VDATEGVEVVEDVEEDDRRGGTWTICGIGGSVCENN